MEKLRVKLVLLAAFAILTHHSGAQDTNNFSRGISIHTGWFGDYFDQMSVEQLTSRSNEFQLDAVNLDGYSVAYSYRAVTAGSVGVSYSQLSKNGKAYIRGGLNVVIDREPLVSYDINTIMDTDYHSLGFCVIESEINVNLSYLKVFPISKRFSSYVGPEIAFGTTFNDQFLLLEDVATGAMSDGFPELEFNISYYDAASTKLFRAGLNAGINYHFGNDHWLLSLESLLGRGKQQIRTYKNQNFTSIRVFTSLRYNF